MTQSDREPFDRGQKPFNRSPLESAELLSGAYWAELRVFLAVAKSGSFNGAANILGMAQPTVSRQIHHVQEVIGAQLITKSKKGVELTHRGEVLARELTKLDKSLSMITSDLASEKSKTQGHVEISISDGLGAFFLVPQLPDLMARHPGISINVKNPVNFLEFEDNLSELMIGFVPQNDRQVKSKKLGNIHFLPVASRGYVHQNGLPTLSNLEDHKFINSQIYSSSSNFWAPWQRILKRGTVSHMTDNSFSYGMMVKQGLGIGLLGSYTTMERDALALELDVRIPMRLYAFVLEERLRSKPVRIVHEWLCKIFGPSNPWFKDEMRLGHNDDPYSIGFRALFNLD